MTYNEWTEIPEGFFECPASGIVHFSRQPVLLHLPGRKQQPLFVSILLHGNEDTGWRALQMVLKKYRGRDLPRRMSVFIGNVEAAAAGVRRLDDQVDFNRIWPGTPLSGTREAQTTAEVVRRMQMLNPFAFIDIHNNTGINPFYACVTDVHAHNLYLARLFSRIAVYFRTPVGTAAGAMAAICPSVTVECGKAGMTAGDEHAAELIEAALHLDHFPQKGHTVEDLLIYHTIATVKVPAALSLAFGDTPADVNFPAHFEEWNFRELEAGCVFAHNTTTEIPFEVSDETGRNTPEKFFARHGDEIRLTRRLMPAMITTNEKIIRQDCLCYLMELFWPQDTISGAAQR